MKFTLTCFFLLSSTFSFSATTCLYTEQENSVNIPTESIKFTGRIFSLITRNLSTLYNYPYSNIRQIVNNKSFYVQDEANSWTPIMKVAHAYGHQLNADNWYNYHLYPWDDESRADYIAGFILNKMGASLHETQRSVLYGIFSAKPKSPIQQPQKAGMEKQSKTNELNKRLHFLKAGYLRALYGY